MLSPNQHTIRTTIRCEGKGLHSGEPVHMTLQPAPAGHGIVFQRMDVEGANNRVPARFDLVTDTMLGTTLTNDADISVATVEHLMAALSGLGVDNILVQLDSPEVPIMDGSSEPFIFLLECAGIKKQEALRPYVRVRKPVRIEQGESWAALHPHSGFSMNLSIAFDHKLIANQKMHLDFNRVSFKGSLCRARTFGFEEDVTKLRAMGLARGGSLDNAIVVGSEQIVNEGGLRYNDEFVRHKMLDCIGDLYLAGGQILGHVEGHRTGHGVNNALLRALFADRDAWELTSMQPDAANDALPLPLPAALSAVSQPDAVAAS